MGNNIQVVERDRANRRVKEDTRTMGRESRKWKMGKCNNLVTKRRGKQSPLQIQVNTQKYSYIKKSFKY